MNARPVTAEELRGLRHAGPPATLADFESIASLRTMFNRERGTPRIVLLLSNTCAACVRGASWIHDELAEHPNAEVEVYAIWLPMLPSDGRPRWDGRILNDPRVTHLWDQQRASGRWFAQHGYGRGTSAGTSIQLPVQWDAFFVYGTDLLVARQREAVPLDRLGSAHPRRNPHIRGRDHTLAHPVTTRIG